MCQINLLGSWQWAQPCRVRARSVCMTLCSGSPDRKDWTNLVACSSLHQGEYKGFDTSAGLSLNSELHHRGLDCARSIMLSAAPRLTPEQHVCHAWCRTLWLPMLPRNLEYQLTKKPKKTLMPRQSCTRRRCAACLDNGQAMQGMHSTSRSRLHRTATNGDSQRVTCGCPSMQQRTQAVALQWSRKGRAI